VTNGGGVRGDKIYPPGTTITRREVLAELPFGNRLVTIDVLGSALKAAIENGLSQLPAPSGRFPQVAGLKIEADLSRSAGNRVLSIMVGDTPLDANKTYAAATITSPSAMPSRSCRPPTRRPLRTKSSIT
jgi:2',3'-cyclic-nucleotide 2'-phosphodiesterase (5'-nucleotidase family)